MATASLTETVTLFFGVDEGAADVRTVDALARNEARPVGRQRRRRRQSRSDDQRQDPCVRRLHF